MRGAVSTDVMHRREGKEPTRVGWLVLLEDPGICERPVGPIADHDVVEDSSNLKTILR